MEKSNRLLSICSKPKEKKRLHFYKGWKNSQSSDWVGPHTVRHLAEAMQTASPETHSPHHCFTVQEPWKSLKNRALRWSANYLFLLLSQGERMSEEFLLYTSISSLLKKLSHMRLTLNLHLHGWQITLCPSYPCLCFSLYQIQSVSNDPANFKWLTVPNLTGRKFSVITKKPLQIIFHFRILQADFFFFNPEV